MRKNTSGQKITLFAIDASTNAPKTGDAANLTAYVSKDDGSVTVLGDTSATELDSTNAKGLYSFDLTQAETNADKLVFSGKSSTSNVYLRPETIYTTLPNDGTATVNLKSVVISNSLGPGLSVSGAFQGAVFNSESGIGFLASGDSAGAKFLANGSDGTGFIVEGGEASSEGITSTLSASEIWAYADRKLTSGTIQVVRPWQVGALNIIKGDSYLVSDSTEIVITKDSTATWPNDLVSAGDYTITFTCTPTGKTEADTADAAVGFSSTGAVVDATTVNLGSITAAQTATLTAGANGYTYTVTASRSTGTIVHTLEAGTLTVGAP